MTRNNSSGSATEPITPRERVLVTLMYLAVVLVGLAAAALLDAGALYLLEQYFVTYYHSARVVEEAHTYASVSFAVFSIAATATHFYAAMFFNRLTSYKKFKHYGFAASCVACLILGIVMTSQSAFRSKTLALIPIMTAFIIGGYLGNRIPIEQNPFRNLKIEK